MQFLVLSILALKSFLVDNDKVIIKFLNSVIIVNQQTYYITMQFLVLSMFALG